MSENVEFEFANVENLKDFNRQYQKLEEQVRQKLPDVPEMDAWGWDYHNLKLMALDTIGYENKCLVKQIGEDEEVQSRFQKTVTRTHQGVKDKAVSKWGFARGEWSCNFSSPNAKDLKSILDVVRDKFKGLGVVITWQVGM